MKSDKEEPKIGSGHAAAMARLGLKELRGALYPGSNVAQPNEHGLYGSLTPGEVAESRKESTLDAEQERGSVLGDHLQRAEQRTAHGRDAKDKEPERE